MAGMFYTMQEVVDKLGKSEDQITQLVQEGKLREFRDGTKLLFKTSEVEALLASPAPIQQGEPIELTPSDSEVELEPVSAPTPPQIPTSSVDDLLMEDTSLPKEELSLEDSISLLMSESGLSDKRAEDASASDTFDVFASEDSETKDTPEVSASAEPVEEVSADDTFDVLALDDADISEGAESDDTFDIFASDDTEDTSPVEAVVEETPAEESVDTPDIIADEEPEAQPAAEAEESFEDSLDILALADDDEQAPIEDQAGDSLDILISEDDSDAATDELLGDDSIKLAETQADAGDSIKLVETSADADAPGSDDSFDILIDDGDSDDAVELKDGSLISDDTLSGIIGGDEPEDELLSSLTKADTAIGNTGINVLSESDGDFQLASDSKSETVVPEDEDDDFDLDFEGDDAGDDADDDFMAESAGLGNLDDDLNLDSIGSGSGLLDLSLQADDTSLGAVLDDILPSAEEEAGEAADINVDDDDFAGEPEQIFEEPSVPVMSAGGRQGVPMAARYAEPEETAVDKACGIAMFLPALLLIYAAIITLFGLKNISPAMLTQVTAEVAGFPMIWLIAGGSAVIFLMILMFAALLGGGSGEKKDKPAKAKKAKKAKKPKKSKKKKK